MIKDNMIHNGSVMYMCWQLMQMCNNTTYNMGVGFGFRWTYILASNLVCIQLGGKNGTLGLVPILVLRTGHI
jgi:hypothetical protein